MPAFDLSYGAAYIIILSTTFIIWSFMVFLIRVFLRYHINGPFGRDDVACAIATFLGIAQSITSLFAVRYGLGENVHDVSDDNLEMVRLIAWLTQIPFILSLSFTMLSISFLICRITKFRTHLLAARALTVLNGIWAITSIFLSAFACDLPKPWNGIPQNRCLNKWNIWAGITAAYIFLELCNLKTALLLVWQVQMPRKAKAKVLAAFALRLLVLPPMITRLKAIHFALTGNDFTADRVNVFLSQQIACHISIILATVPCAKPFFVVFERGAFRSPQHPENPTQPSSANTSRVGSAATNEGAPSFAWNYRSSFAKGGSDTLIPPAPTKARRRVRIAPWTWNRRQVFETQDGLYIPLDKFKSKQSSSTSRSATGNNTPTPHPSSHEHHSLRLRRDTQNRSENSSSAQSATSSSARLRRISEGEWIGALRPDEGKTTTSIDHDPLYAEEATRNRAEETDEMREARRRGIEQTQTVEVTYSEWDQQSFNCNGTCFRCQISGGRGAVKEDE